MAHATCPSCKTKQELPAGSDGYRCEVCGREWVLARCSGCSGRFHAKPGTAAWTCPRCGTHNVTGAAQPIGAQAAGGRAAGEGIRDRVAQVAASARSATARPAGVRAPLPGGPWAPVLAGGGAAVVLFVVLHLLGVFGGEPATPTASPREVMCGHIAGLQITRVDALNRTAGVLDGDADALRAAGDAATARKVTHLANAARALSTALQTEDPSDDSAAIDGMNTAKSKLGCGL